jgi:hypothetical protein
MAFCWTAQSLRVSAVMTCHHGAFREAALFLLTTSSGNSEKGCEDFRRVHILGLCLDIKQLNHAGKERESRPKASPSAC